MEEENQRRYDLNSTDIGYMDLVQSSGVVVCIFLEARKVTNRQIKYLSSINVN